MKNIYRQSRTYLNLEYHYVSGQLGISIDHLEDIESGKEIPDHNLLIRISDLYGTIGNSKWEGLLPKIPDDLQLSDYDSSRFRTF